MNPDPNTLAHPKELEIYQRVFHASPDYVSFSCLESGVYIDINPAYAQFIGYTREQLIGRSSIELGVWLTPDERNAYVQALLAQGTVCAFGCRLRHHSGEVRHVEMSGTIAEINGQRGIVTVVRDVTVRKRDEDELIRYRDHLEQVALQRTAELEQANLELRKSNEALVNAHHQLLQTEKMASIGQLAAGVAHEINNPLGFVNSNLSSLEEYFHDLLEMIDVYESNEDVLAQYPERLANIAAVKKRIDLAYLKEDISALLAESSDGMLRVKKIVQDLKDFSHVGSAEWQWANIHAGIDSTLNIVNNEIKYKAAVVKEYGNLPDIECLPLELNQVFMNMLVNAAQAIEQYGEIRIRTCQEEDQIWIEFRDNGPGISQENITRIFDPFFTTKPVGKGTGLGLSLSYGIVQKHHGRIDVDSTPGQGTTFRIWLPVQQTSTAAE